MTTRATPAASVPRLLAHYRKEIVPALKQRFGLRNDLRVPRLRKIVVNMGVGAGAADVKAIEAAAQELTLITGQKAVVTRAKKSIANFKVKEGNLIGCKVTLRRRMMYEFLDRLVNVAIPRMRDFRGLSPNAFDGRGSYNLGITDQTIFPEIEVDKVTRTQGMNVTIVTSARTDEEARELLRLFGMPFRAKPAVVAGRDSNASAAATSSASVSA